MNHHPSATSPAKSVLIVEDDADIRAVLTEFLEDDGYQVASTSNGLDALTYLHDHALPSVILLDLMMPIMNGFQFREAQQGDPLLAAIPVVVMTARGALEPGMKGIADVLGKPMDLWQLLESLDKAQRAALPPAA